MVLFFSQGIEHAVVNMFVMPVGMGMGAEIDRSPCRFLSRGTTWLEGCSSKTWQCIVHMVLPR